MSASTSATAPLTQKSNLVRSRNPAESARPSGGRVSHPIVVPDSSQMGRVSGPAEADSRSARNRGQPVREAATAGRRLPQRVAVKLLMMRMRMVEEGGRQLAESRWRPEEARTSGPLEAFSRRCSPAANMAARAAALHQISFQSRRLLFLPLLLLLLLLLLFLPPPPLTPSSFLLHLLSPPPPTPPPPLLSSAGSAPSIRVSSSLFIQLMAFVPSGPMKPCL